SDRRDAAVHGDDLAGDERARVRGEQHRDALQVLGTTDAVERRLARYALAEHFHEALRHLRREETGRDRVHVDVVLRPLRGERAGEADDAALARVVGDGSGTRAVVAADEPEDG